MTTFATFCIPIGRISLAGKSPVLDFCYGEKRFFIHQLSILSPEAVFPSLRVSAMMHKATQYSGDATSQLVSAMGAEREIWTGHLRSGFLYEVSMQRIRSRYVLSHTQMCFFLI